MEEKKIPYKVEKINMRSYGDKPAAFLRVVPNGLLPAISIDGKLQTESLEIMLNLERRFLHTYIYTYLHTYIYSSCIHAYTHKYIHQHLFINSLATVQYLDYQEFLK